MQDHIVKAEKLAKTFDKNVALNSIDLNIPKGKIFGLLGPNGAGKTTFIRLITQIFSPDSGQLFFDGQPLSKSNIYDIGYMPEERGLYKKMKVGEQLVYLSQLRNLSAKEARNRIKHWFEKFEIEDWWTKKVEELSKGMQQKIQFVATVIHDPKLLILDEPFSGLDPVNTNLITNEINELQKKGTSIVFSTHRMEQVEQICEDIVLINKGNIVLEGSVADIKNQFKANHYLIQFEGQLTPENIPRGFKLLDQQEKTLKFELTDHQNSNELIRALINHQVEIHGVTEILPSLNEIFINEVKKKFIHQNDLKDE
ncbi:MAG: ATP-binding cassette domain-containing protein [Bacteroidetes bacterium]|nr:ATP-binding cassette domain-containing protein [Bacteroidota bacterium]